MLTVLKTNYLLFFSLIQYPHFLILEMSLSCKCKYRPQVSGSRGFFLVFFFFFWFILFFMQMSNPYGSLARHSSLNAKPSKSFSSLLCFRCQCCLCLLQEKPRILTANLSPVKRQQYHFNKISSSFRSPFHISRFSHVNAGFKNLFHFYILLFNKQEKSSHQNLLEEVRFCRGKKKGKRVGKIIIKL